MLSELVLVATSVSGAEGGANSPEACISFYDVHTHSSSSSQTTTSAGTGSTVLKKSTSPPNCVASSASHVFAAQGDKATLNVYNRAKGNLETTLPLPEQLSAVACSSGGGLVATGTVTGRLNVWETASGRYTSTDLAHLQKVTIVTFDHTGNLVLTGSADSNVHVWSVPLLLDPKSDKRPLRTLERHRAEITGIVCAKGSGPATMAITASRDMSCIAWNPYYGTLLRTFMFPLSPTCIALDPADRGFYTGFEDGTIKLVEFATLSSQQSAEQPLQLLSSHHPNGTSAMNEDSSPPANNATTTYENHLFSDENRNIPTPVPQSRWSAEGHDAPLLAISPVLEGNYVVTGDAKGVVAVWDVATGHLFRVLARHKAPITNLNVLPPTGFPKTPTANDSREKQPTTVQTAVVAPRYHNVVRATNASAVDEGADAGLPPITVGFNGVIPASDFSPFGGATAASGVEKDIFSAAADMDAVQKGLKAFASPASMATANNVGATSNSNAPVLIDTAGIAAEDSEKVQKLEKELADMHDKYERLSRIHKQTWEEHSKWMMAVDAEKAEKAEAEEAEQGEK